MRSPDPGVRSGLANALGQTQSPAALPFLLELLGDATPRPRIVAIRYLAHVGTKQQLAVLKPILNDADIAVRVTAAGAIGRLLNKGDRQN
jgi:HEAT repeat protein